MMKPSAKSSPREVVVRRSFETEKTLVETTVASHPSIFSSWQRWVPGFRRDNNAPRCMKTAKGISSDFAGLPSESCLAAVCNCPKCISEAKARSREIDRELQRDAELAENDKTVLLLGFRESIDQISKQVLRVDKDPYTTEELNEKKIPIRRQTFNDMANQLYSWSPEYQGTRGTTHHPVGGVDEKDVKSLLVEVEACDILTPEQAIVFESIWLRYWGNRRRKPHPSTYFLSNLVRIASSSYTPTETDISNLPLGFSRFRPLPTIHHHSQTHATLRLNLIHQNTGCCCGGKQLLHLFSNTSAVIFPLDLTYFSQTQEKYSPPMNPSSNVINEGTSLFSSVADASWFKDVPIFLWLGNAGKFKTMVEEEKEGMEKYVPGCDAGKDGDKAVDFIAKKYLNCAMNRKNVCVILLDAIDEKSVKKAISEMGDIMLTWNVKGERTSY